MPHIAVYEKSGEIRSVTNIKWSHISSVNEINSDDIFRLLAAAEKLNCDNAVMLYPSYAQIPDTKLTMDCSREIALTIKFADFSEGSEVAEFICEVDEENEGVSEYEDCGEIEDDEFVAIVGREMAEPMEFPVEENEKISEVTAETEAAETNPMPEKKRVKILRHKK